MVLALIMSIFQVLYGQQFQSDAFKLIMLIIIFGLSKKFNKTTEKMELGFA